MKELKENIKNTINESCLWVQKELKKDVMPASTMEVIPEALKAISELVDSLEKMKNYPSH